MSRTQTTATRSAQDAGRYASRAEWHALYNRKVWKQTRLAVLQESPLCVRCMKLGRSIPATVVDHIIPHRGDETLFFDRDNLQSLCKPCHDGWKHRVEIGALEKHEFGADGFPIG